MKSDEDVRRDCEAEIAVRASHCDVPSLNGAADRKAPPKEQTVVSGLREGERDPTADGQSTRPHRWVI